MAVTDPKTKKKTDSQIPEDVSGLAHFSKEGFNFLYYFAHLMERLKVFLDTASPVMHAFPPVKLALTSVVNIWDMLKAGLLEKGQVPTRAARILLGAAVIALVAVGIAIPPLGGAMLVAGAAVSFFKESLLFFKDVGKNFLDGRTLAKKKEELSTVNPLKEPDRYGKLAKEITDLTQKRNASAKSFPRKGMGLFWGAMALVGAALSITPLAPVGWGLLAASAVGGLSTAIGFAIKDKLDAKKAAKQTQPVSNSAVQKEDDVKETHSHKHEHTQQLDHEHSEKEDSTQKMALDFARTNVSNKQNKADIAKEAVRELAYADDAQISLDLTEKFQVSNDEDIQKIEENAAEIIEKENQHVDLSSDVPEISEEYLAAQPQDEELEDSSVSETSDEVDDTEEAEEESFKKIE